MPMFQKANRERQVNDLKQVLLLKTNVNLIEKQSRKITKTILKQCLIEDIKMKIDEILKIV